MNEQIESKSVVVRQDYDAQLRDYERGLLSFLAQHNLPTQSVFSTVSERVVVFQMLEKVLFPISIEKREQSIYISKFVGAVAHGQFDAALNFLWDETISELRQKVAQYDISYFYDNAISNVEKRKKLNSVDDLLKIEDSELIQGAKKISLISDLGFKHLEFILYMRNWASAAHPNQNQITGIQLTSWLETCIREVISLEISIESIQIKRLLDNIKNISLSEVEAKEIASLNLNITQEQVNNLVSGFFGMYTRPDTAQQTRQNIHFLLPLLWDRVDEQTRLKLGANYGKYAAISDQERKGYTRQFLEIVSAAPYLADDFRIPEIENAIDNLLLAHRAASNFYNEPAFARALKNIVGTEVKVPAAVNRKYVIGLAEVFLTNGHGVAWNAEPIYRSLIDLFDAKQAGYAILSVYDDNIASKLQFSKCQEKYHELLEMMKKKVSAPAIKELIEEIESFKGPIENLRDNKWFNQKRINLMKTLG